MATKMMVSGIWWWANIDLGLEGVMVQDLAHGPGKETTLIIDSAFHSL